MTLNTLAFMSAMRIILSALLGWATSRGWINVGPAWNTVFLDVGCIGILGWSIYEGVNQARDVWSNVIALARDIVAVSLNWAAGMGYIGKGDVVGLEAAIGTAALYVWSLESKHLNLQLAKIVPFLVMGLGAMLLYGCAGSVSLGGSDAQITIYNLGEDALPLVQGLSLVPALPAQACTAAKAADTAFDAAAQIAVTGVGSTAAVMSDLENAVTALGSIALTVGISSLRKAPGHPLLAATVSADPTPAQWSALKAQLSAAVAGLHCY